jgi:hypothetical protein
MLKTVSSITNAIGALNYKGTWNASTNSPALASGVGTKGDYYVVSVAGSTALDGISNWGVGDWAAFNGTAWQRVEGGADLNGVNLSVSGTSTLSGLTASTALALNASKEVVSVTNTGTGNNVLATSPSLTTPNIGAASGTSLSVTGALGCGTSLTTGAFNITASYSFNDNNVNNIGGSGAYTGRCFIFHIFAQTGLCSIPIFPNGGAGVGWGWNYLDPDAGTWGYSATSPIITFTIAGTAGNTFALQLNSNTGAATIQRTGGSNSYTVYIQQLTGA